MSRERVFISAETSEFWQLRDELHDALVKRGYYVSFQRTLRNEGLEPTVIHQISASLGKCQKAIFLIGSRGGALPNESEVQGFEAFLPVGWSRATYTQWEFFLATMRKRQHRPDLVNLRFWVWLSPSTCQEPKDVPDESDLLQDQFRELVSSFPQPIRIPCERQSQLVDTIIASDAFSNSAAHRPCCNFGFTSIGPAFHGRLNLFTALLNDWSAYWDNPVGFFSRFLHGPPGIGKTTAAIEFAYRYRRTFEATFFITGKSPEQLVSNFASIANDLGDADVAVGDKYAKCRRAAELLSQKSPWLLILDNIDSRSLASAAETLLCNLTGGFVLMTGRYECTLRFAPQFIKLPALTTEEGARLILDRTSSFRHETESDFEHSTRLSEDLEGLPLALEQACHYIRAKEVTIARYHELWRNSLEESEGWSDSEGYRFDKGVVASFLPTFESLTHDANACLKIVACLAPGSIPKSWLFDTTILLSLDYCLELLEVEPQKPSGKQDQRVKDAIRCLKSYGLVTVDQGRDMLSIHRVTRRVSRCVVQPSTLLEFSRIAGNILLSALSKAGDAFDAGIKDEKFNAALIPHASELELALERSDEFQVIWAYLDSYRESSMRRKRDELDRLVTECRVRIESANLRGRVAMAEWEATEEEIVALREENNVAITSFLEANSHRVLSTDDQNKINGEAARRFMDDKMYRSALANTRFELGKLAFAEGDVAIAQLEFEQSMRFNEVFLEPLMMAINQPSLGWAHEEAIYAAYEAEDMLRAFDKHSNEEPAVRLCLSQLKRLFETQGIAMMATACDLLLRRPGMVQNEVADGEFTLKSVF